MGLWKKQSRQHRGKLPDQHNAELRVNKLAPAMDDPYLQHPRDSYAPDMHAISITSNSAKCGRISTAPCLELEQHRLPSTTLIWDGSSSPSARERKAAVDHAHLRCVLLARGGLLRIRCWALPEFDDGVVSTINRSSSVNLDGFGGASIPFCILAHMEWRNDHHHRGAIDQRRLHVAMWALTLVIPRLPQSGHERSEAADDLECLCNEVESREAAQRPGAPSAIPRPHAAWVLLDPRATRSPDRAVAACARGPHTCLPGSAFIPPPHRAHHQPPTCPRRRDPKSRKLPSDGLVGEHIYHGCRRRLGNVANRLVAKRI